MFGTIRYIGLKGANKINKEKKLRRIIQQASATG